VKLAAKMLVIVYPVKSLLHLFNWSQDIDEKKRRNLIRIISNRTNKTYHT
jgi:hypothetical protein